jgi:hypothetical protein
MNVAKDVIDRINNKSGKPWNDKDKLLICLLFISENSDMDAFEDFLTDTVVNGIADDDGEDDRDDEDEDDVDLDIDDDD